MRTRTSVVIAIALGLLAAVPLHGQRPDSALAGEWIGVAHISVDWCLQRELPVDVTIREDGSVSGRVGDATLRSGRITTNRTRIARAMGLGTDWVIAGELAGPIILHEAVVRDRVRIALNWAGVTLAGDLATSGSYEPRRDDMVLLASGLVLRRVGAVQPPTPR